MILVVDSDHMIWACPCGQRQTYYYNVGMTSSAPGPFSLEDQQTLVFRFDNDQGSPGTIETVTILASAFNDVHNISTDELVAFLNSKLVAGEALNDFNTVLIRSKTSGPTSCAEVPDGTARDALGLLGTNYNSQPHCCGRICLGFRPLPLQDGKLYPDMVLLRHCHACGLQTTLIMNNYPKQSDESDLYFSIRQAVLVLGKLLYDNGWLDPDLVDYFSSYPPVFNIVSPAIPFITCSYEVAMAKNLVGIKIPQL